MIPARRRWLAGALIVGLGWLASPDAVPVYDGLQAPDEPYRFVAPPSGATKTAEPTSTTADLTVADGTNLQGMTVSTAEMGPQFSVFLPQHSLAAKGRQITVAVTPEAPAGLPSGKRADGNAYRVELRDPAGPVTLTDKAALATLYMRATTQEKPQPTMWFRPDAGEWKQLDTTAGGFDIRVASFLGSGDYVLVAERSADDKGGVPLAPLVVVVVLVGLVGVVLVVRLRAQPSE